MFIRTIRQTFEYRELLLALTYRDIKVKYKQAMLGVLWVFFLPTMAIGSGIVFRLAMAYFSNSTPKLVDMVAVMVKSVPWLLFAAIVGGSSGSLIGNMGLITKVYFPRQVVPLATVLSALFDFTISLTGLTLIIILIANLAPGGDTAIVVTWHYLWLPVLLMLLVVMAVGFGFFFSCTNLFMRDVRYIVQVSLQYGVFFSLVFLTYEEFGRFGHLFLYNPVAPVLESIRTIITRGQINADLLPYLVYSAVFTICLLTFALRFFNRSEPLFAEYV